MFSMTQSNIKAVLVTGLIFMVESLADACGGRRIFNSTSGIITDGTGDYRMSISCEWLITGTVKMFVLNRCNWGASK